MAKIRRRPEYIATVDLLLKVEATSAASSENPFASRDWRIEATQSGVGGTGSDDVCPIPGLSGDPDDPEGSWDGRLIAVAVLGTTAGSATPALLVVGLCSRLPEPFLIPLRLRREVERRMPPDFANRR